MRQVYPFSAIDGQEDMKLALLIAAVDQGVGGVHAWGPRAASMASAAEAMRELAEMCDIHVVTTLMARGAFPDDHRLCLGMPGMHGNYTAITSMQESDLLIALGSRFDDRVRPLSITANGLVVHNEDQVPTTAASSAKSKRCR